MKTTFIMALSNILLALAFYVGGQPSRAANSPALPAFTNQTDNGKGLYTVPDSQIVWGGTTNFLRADPGGTLLPTIIRVGIRSSNGVIVLSGKPLRLAYPSAVYLESPFGRPIWDYPEITNNGVRTSATDVSNIVYFLFMPPERNRCNMEMKDPDGAPVAKTAEGRELGYGGLGPRTYWYLWRRIGCRPAFLLPHQDYEEYSLDPSKYFRIDNPGLYRLTLVQRLYVIDTNAYLKAIVLPPVTVNVRVEDK